MRGLTAWLLPDGRWQVNINRDGAWQVYFGEDLRETIWRALVEDMC